MIYLDNAATTKIFPEALQAYCQTSENYWGNPSSLHNLGTKAHTVLDKAREMIAKQLGVETDSIYFTSGGTESNNWAIKGTAIEKRQFGKHIITTKIEHPSVLQSMRQLEMLGYEVTYIAPNKNGVVSAKAIQKAIRKDTILVSVMAVNNEIGAIQPIHEIGAMLEEYPTIHFHVDAVQAVESVREVLTCQRIDLLSLSAHKFHGPRGVGILYKKIGKMINPLLTGGGQEKNLRSTTENLPGIVATAKALRLTLEQKNNMASLREVLWQYLEEEENIKIFSPKDGAEHVLCFAMHGVRGEVLVHALEEEGFYISTTSACSSKKGAHSGTLMAMNVPDDFAKCAVRVSFSKDNTTEEVKALIKALKELKHKFAFLRK